MNTPDVETRDRLVGAAAELFAARGFGDVTVREICTAAGANVAAVNYHFGDKLGLYKEVLARAVQTMQATTEAARKAGQSGTPEMKLRAYVLVFLQRVALGSRDSWIHQLMTRELADPSPALELIAEEVIRPRQAYLSELVAEMLGCAVDDERVARCVSSVLAQCHAAVPSRVMARVFGQSPSDPAAIDRLAGHIADFSLAGIKTFKGMGEPRVDSDRTRNGNQAR